MTGKEKKLWGGRFREKPSSILERIGESVSFDHKLYKEDIQGSIAHARMLKQIGILNESELSDIETSLAQIRIELEEGKLEFKSELEDIHMHIESRLTELIGETGKKLHTARSRNDQVTQDVRLYILNRGKEILRSIVNLRSSLYEKAKRSVDVIIPGYTHLQVAQPIRASQYLLSWFWALERDQEFFRFALKASDELALGSGAMAGVNYPTDREFLKKELGLSNISPNSMDAVSSRDHILEFLFACTQLMIRASRICEDIVLYSSQEFGILKLSDSLTTGSSIMPQKKKSGYCGTDSRKSGKSDRKFESSTGDVEGFAVDLQSGSSGGQVGAFRFGRNRGDQFGRDSRNDRRLDLDSRKSGIFLKKRICYGYGLGGFSRLRKKSSVSNGSRACWNACRNLCGTKKDFV